MLSTKYLINIFRVLSLGLGIVWLWGSVLGGMTPESYAPTIIIFACMLIADYLSRIQLLIIEKNNYIIPMLAKVLIVANIGVYFVMVLPVISGGYIPLKTDSGGLHIFVDTSMVPFDFWIGEIKLYLKRALEIAIIAVVATEYFFYICPTLDREEYEAFLKQLRSVNEDESKRTS
ncbi:hypothetical protein A6395_13430 [Exiguobacterium sp. SH31]|uniref:hypothetical protein n=1 Tax=Exiguobacterium sp. SH31 TaxID=1843183 RepID=UPI0008D84228|nr:hypothetical protein [Exiguobacterium sp. SH31]OGX78132.1 hypothetical protein A6395_13430 [Exiguobacterium sp. SH31]